MSQTIQTMKKIASIALALAIGAAMPVYGARKQDNPNNVLSRTITDESIIFPESFEQDTQKLLEGWFLKNYTATDQKYATEEDVDVSDAEIERRLSALPTVIEMPYNQVVRKYIDRYTRQGRKQVAAMLGLSLYYMPIFEQALEARGLPLELKYLPVIESGLDPNAVSKHGATGLWQFMLNSAKGLGMEVNSLVDMRRDPYVSSAKAAEYLKQLYDTYGDWTLAIAAYNCGPTTVNKAIRRAGGEAKDQDFWSIYSYLPAETRGYVPAFIAANYVMNYHNKHRISPVLPTKPLVTDTVAVHNRIHFDQISKVLNIPVEELRMLNPQFRADLIPASVQAPYMIVLPSQQVHAYIMSEDQIKGYNAEQYAQRTNVAVTDNDVAMVEPAAADTQEVTPAPVPAPETPATPTPAAPAPKAAPKVRTVNHTVRAGQSINDVAALYEVTPSQIRQWNGLRRNAVRPGQQLRIETTVTESEVASNTTPAKVEATQTVASRTESAAPAKPTDKKETATADKKGNTSASGKKANSATETAASAKNTGKKNTAATEEDTKTTGKYGKKNTAATEEDTKTTGKYGKNSKNGKKNTADTTAKGKKGRKKSKTQPAAPTSHKVANGDNLYDIAKEHGTTVEALRDANPKLKGDVIQPGDKLNLPKKSKGSSTKSSGKKSSGKSSKKRR